MVAAELARDLHSSSKPLAAWAGARANTTAKVTELRASAEESMASMRAMIAESVVERVEVDLDSDPADLSADERSEYEEQLNATLAIVRATRQLFEGDASEHFSRLVSVHVPDLAPEHGRLRTDFVRYAREMERTLIFFGAGTDEDADLVRDLVPEVAYSRFP